VAMSLFGRGRNSGVCVSCGSEKIKRKDFKDPLSWREFGISGLCQACQDSVWKPK
jgi:hypothetical protein